MIRKVFIFLLVVVIGGCSKDKELSTFPPIFVKPFTKLIFIENIDNVTFGRNIIGLKSELERQYGFYELTISGSKSQYINYIARVDRVADNVYKWSLFDSVRNKVLSVYTFFIGTEVSNGEYLRLMIEALKKTYSNYAEKNIKKTAKQVVCVKLSGSIPSETWSRLLIASLKASLSSNSLSKGVTVGNESCLVDLSLNYSEEKFNADYKLKFNWELSSVGKQSVRFDQSNVLNKKDYEMLPHNFFLLTDYIAQIVGNYI